MTTRTRFARRGNVSGVLAGAALALSVLALIGTAGAQGDATVTTYASGLTNPRGLAFGPDGKLYVALGGTGGDHGTEGQCDQVPAPIGPDKGGTTGSIVAIDDAGTVTTVADGLASSVDAMGDQFAVADVAFLDGTLYALTQAGGCSHGNPDAPQAVLKVNDDGTTSVVADLGAFYQANPVAEPNPADFEPDGDPYDMVAYDGALWVVEANHGSLEKVTPDGTITRVVDFSNSYGHLVPTTIAVDGDAFLVGNLGTFPIVPGNQMLLKVGTDGSLSDFAKGLTTVLGVAVDDNGNVFALESVNAAGMPQPGKGDVVEISANGDKTTIASGLTTPTAMVVGPDGALYVSAQGYGAPAGAGAILKIVPPM